MLYLAANFLMIEMHFYHKENTMKLLAKAGVGVLIIATILAACGPTGGDQTTLPDNGSMQTSAAETAMFIIVQTQLAQVTVAQPNTSTPTPSITDTPTMTPEPTFTATPTVPEISVSIDTNCRTGPGKIYTYSGGLLVGEKAEVLGRNSLGDYWYVHLPAGTLCWLWGEYATITGDVSKLPIFTPPPTPTPEPNFTVEYSYLESCVGWDPAFKVTNTGGVTFKSHYVSVLDTVTNTTQTFQASNFDKRTGCVTTELIPTLPSGGTGWIYANSFVTNPTGHLMKATVKVCTEINQTGFCVTKSLEFTP